MFNFVNLSKKEEEDVFQASKYHLSVTEFYRKRRTASKPYVFDLRGAESYQASHLPGAHNLPIEHFEYSIYQMPFAGDILLYGSTDGEVLTAAEILYDNGFDTFYFLESYEDLQQLDKEMLTITEAARSYLRQEERAHSNVYITVETRSPTKAIYKLKLLDSSENTPEECTKLDWNGINILVANSAIPYLEGTLLNFEDEELKIHNSSMSIAPLVGSVEEKVTQIIEEQVRPMVASHGGNVRLHEIKDNEIYLEFGGGCQGCGMISVTLKQGIEVMIKESIPDIVAVHDITDHQVGSQPYYTG